MSKIARSIESNMTYCDACNQAYSKSYYNRHIKTNKHKKNVVKENEIAVKVKKVKKLNVVIPNVHSVSAKDIDIFFETSSRGNNDATNKLREKILVLLGNNSDFIEQFKGTGYYA